MSHKTLFAFQTCEDIYTYTPISGHYLQSNIVTAKVLGSNYSGYY